MRKPYPTNRKSSARTHGCARKPGRTPEYQAWLNLRARCLHTYNNRYASHGGRGIRVCERWLGPSGFQAFLLDMGLKPLGKYTVERIDNDGNYEPGNCRWATLKEQANNRRDNRYLTHEGKKMKLHEWATILGIGRTTISERLRRGWSVSRALSTPLR